MVLLKLACGLLGVGYAIFDGAYLQHSVNGVTYFRLMSELIKSPSDRSSYCVLRLENGLYVLLASSSASKETVAALDVNAGYRDDPSSVAGLAHLVEHLLFTGSSKYPEKDGFEVFAKTRGGKFNAYTSYEHTRYFFSVATPYLEEALDRFCDMFLSPLFTEAGLRQELPIMDQEYHQHRLEDATCRQHVIGSLSRNHSFGNFAQGNSLSLAVEGRSIPDMAKAFFRENYSTSRMKLVVAGNKTLDELTETVVPLFSHLPRSEREPLLHLNSPYSRVEFKKIVRYIPTSGLDSMEVLFFLPAQLPLYDTKPAKYLTTLLGRGERGSPAALLSLLGYSNGLKCSIAQDAASFSLLLIKIAVTPKGLENYQEVLHILFQDIRMLKKNATWQWHYPQKMMQGEVEFRFMQPQLTEKRVQSLAYQMQAPIPVEHILLPQDRLLRYDEQQIKNTLDLISPDSMTILLQSRKFAQEPNLQKDPHYNSRFSVEPIPAGLVRKLQVDRPRKRLLPPEPNPFLPTDFSIVDSTDTSRIPQAIICNQMATLWHVDGGFATPHAHVRIFISNRHSIISPRIYVGLDMMAAVINSKLRTLEQQAREAGMSLTVEAQYAGIAIQAAGFSQHMEQLLVNLASLFSLEHVSQANFDASKGWLASEIASSQSALIPQLLHEKAKYALFSKVFSNRERSEQLDAITLNDTKDLGRLFFKQVHVDALVIGNLSPQASEALLSRVMHHLGVSPSILSKIEPRPSIEITPPGSFVYETTMAKDSGVAATLVYLDMYDYPNVTLRAHTELLSTLLPMPFLNYFRNEEALSISVKVSIRRLTSRGGIQFIVESTHDPAYIERHINLFLFKFEKSIASMPAIKFQGAVAVFSTKKCTPPTNMGLLANKLWYSIRSGYYDFHEDATVCKTIDSITKDTLLHIIRNQLLPNAPNRRKLSIRMVPPTLSLAEESEHLPLPGPSDGTSPDTFILDLDVWKKEQKLSPLPYPILTLCRNEPNS